MQGIIFILVQNNSEKNRKLFQKSKICEKVRKKKRDYR